MYKLFERIKDLFKEVPEQELSIMSICNKCGCEDIKYKTVFTNFDEVLEGYDPQYETTATCEKCGYSETINCSFFKIPKHKGLN